MKRWLCLLLVCVLCLSACSAKPNSNKEPEDHPDEDIFSEESDWEKPDLEEPNATLVVCGKEIEGDYYARIDYEAKTEEFPLVVVAQAIGAKIERKSSRIVDIVFEDTTYRLNIPKKELIDRNSDKGNILRISPGATKPAKAYATEDDVIVNGVMSSYFEYLRGIRVRIDYENTVIYVEYNQSKNDVTKTATR